MTYRITSNYFCAGIISEDNKIIESAPILYKLAASCRWQLDKFIIKCIEKKWKVEKLNV